MFSFSKILFVLTISVLCSDLCAASGKRESKVLSRRKRYVAFPEGSSFSCAGCMTVGVIGQPAPTSSPGTFTWGMNWGIAYELPNVTEAARFYRFNNKIRKPAAQRRSRRDLYQKLETIIEYMGYNGRQCILKTLCESRYRIVPDGTNMIEEMFRTLFSLPITKNIISEPMDMAIYDAAHRINKALEDCDKYQCPFSLIDLIKGYYNAPAPSADDDVALKPWTLFSSSFG